MDPDDWVCMRVAALRTKGERAKIGWQFPDGLSLFATTHHAAESLTFSLYGYPVVIRADGTVEKAP